MLAILWRSFDKSHHSALKALMVKFGLMVPLPATASQDAASSPSSPPSPSSAVPLASASVYKVPALLPDQPLPRTGFVPRSCFFVFFSLDPFDGHADKAAMEKKGFLPDGLFSRVLGGCRILLFVFEASRHFSELTIVFACPDAMGCCCRQELPDQPGLRPVGVGAASGASHERGDHG